MGVRVVSENEKRQFMSKLEEAKKDVLRRDELVD